MFAVYDSMIHNIHGVLDVRFIQARCISLNWLRSHWTV